MTSPRLSVVVPVFDEAAILEGSLARLLGHLRAGGASFELFCVDDGSRDGTAEILARHAPEVRTLSHAQNRGKGAAVRTGALAASGERIVFLDADLSTDLDDLGALLAALDGGADVALGSRRLAGSRIERRQPALRELCGRVFSRLARLSIAPEVLDFTCGFKAFRREAAAEIFSRARVERWAFDAELIAIAKARGRKLAQVPVRWSHSGSSKVRVVGAALGSLAALGAIVWRLRTGAYRD
ncbi:MAG TPA: dolichyl-phosphate beta-glucosyltransferase [Planctomycetota bacterium]|nr:dolichyl-phosphate beta-glucosyltransferase [Planctomycetota bacterium]